MKNSLLIPEEFFDAKKLWTLSGANQNSSLRSSDDDLLMRERVVLVFWLKFLKSSQTIFQIRVLEGSRGLQLRRSRTSVRSVVGPAKGNVGV